MKLKNMGETTRSVTYNLYQIPYEYTVEMNIFKKSDLLNRVPVELWTEACNILQEVKSKTIPKKNKYKTTWLSENALQIVEKIREEKAREKGRDTPN